MAEEKKLYIEGRLHRPNGQDHYVADIVDIEGFNGTSETVKTAIFEALKNKLQGANGISITPDDNSQKIIISCGTAPVSRELQSISWQGMSLSPTSIESGSTAVLTIGNVIGHYSDNTTEQIASTAVQIMTPTFISLSNYNATNSTYTVTAKTGITSNQSGNIYVKYNELSSTETLAVSVIPKDYVLWENMSIQPTRIISGSTGQLTLGTVKHWNRSSLSDITTSAANYYASAGSVEPESPRNGETYIKIWAPTNITTNKTVTISTAYIDQYTHEALTGTTNIKYTVIPKKVESISLMNDKMPRAIFANQNYSDRIFNYSDITGAVTVKYNDNSSKNVYNRAIISYTYTYTYTNITNVKVSRVEIENYPYEELTIYPQNIIYTLTGNQTDPSNDIITLQSTITAQYTENGTLVSQSYPISIYPFHEAIIDTSYGYLHSGTSITSRINLFNDNQEWKNYNNMNIITSSYSYSYSGKYISGLGVESTRYFANIVYGTSGTISLGIPDNDSSCSADSFKIIDTNIIPKDITTDKYIYSYSYTPNNTNAYVFSLNAFIQAPGPDNSSPYLHVSFQKDSTPGGDEPETPTYYWYAGQNSNDNFITSSNYRTIATQDEFETKTINMTVGNYLYVVVPSNKSVKIIDPASNVVTINYYDPSTTTYRRQQNIVTDEYYLIRTRATAAVTEAWTITLQSN